MVMPKRTSRGEDVLALPGEAEEDEHDLTIKRSDSGNPPEKLPRHDQASAMVQEPSSTKESGSGALGDQIVRRQAVNAVYEQNPSSGNRSV